MRLRFEVGGTDERTRPEGTVPILWLTAGVVATGTLLVLLAPVLPGWLSAAVYASASLVCHQRPERSFYWGEAQLAVCARCAGIYLGAGTASIALALAGPTRALGLEPIARPGLLLSAAPLVGSVLLEWVSVWSPSHLVRAFTGAIFGAGSMGFVAIGVVLAWKASRPTLHYR